MTSSVHTLHTGFPKWRNTSLCSFSKLWHQLKLWNNLLPTSSLVFPLLAFCVLLCACLQCVDVCTCRGAKLTLVTRHNWLRQGHSLKPELANSSLLAHSRDCLCLPASQLLGFQVTFSHPAQFSCGQAKSHFICWAHLLSVTPLLVGRDQEGSSFLPFRNWTSA